MANVPLEFFKIGCEGTNIASAENMLAPSGDFVTITGDTQISTMAVGSSSCRMAVYLKFVSNPTIKHETSGTGAQFSFKNGEDYTVTAGEVLQFVFDGTYWHAM
jgi:hypothetical protein